MNVRESTELRKLTPTYSLELARLLHDSWKILMSKIPEKLEKDKYECKITSNNLPKYNSRHIRLIEEASISTKRLSADILFEEWGSSGHIRPTLGHLFFLLKECRLYGPADYVAKILGQHPPQRPRDGPEAKVELTPTERKQIEESNNDIRNMLEGMRDLSSTIEQINFNPSESAHTQNLPQIIINDQLDSTENNVDASIRDSGNCEDHINNYRIFNSDLIQFSSNKIPDISNLLNSNSENIQKNIETIQSISNDALQSIVPHFSALMHESTQLQAIYNSNLPNVSMFKSDTSIINSESCSNFNLPDFDALQSGVRTDTQSVSIPRTFGSPLPSLSLNTLLNHYPYAKLEIATNYFNETPFINSLSGEPGNCTGRFLGSGAFGSVYIAFGILKQPIAVKKINLRDLNIVRADDIITKQFTTEVEILYKYKHDNLLSLIGYSCDGLTYCLLYEYVPGGNLKDRLQMTTNSLSCFERLNIAIGTADAVAYLHTAYAIPLIHRDIKSANILLDAINQPKLCDFGIIRISSSSTTGTNQIMGTSAYMSPEAHRGDVSVKMDSYSFGVVLLELLTGLPPVDHERNGNDIVTYIQDNLEDETDITPLLDERAGSWKGETVDYARELYTITMKCLQEKKNIRPTMVNVRDNLKTIFPSRKM